MRLHRVVSVIVLTAGLLAAQSSPDQRAFARDLLRELIEINTTDSVGNVTQAAEAMAARFRAAGFPDADVQVLGAAPNKGNLVVRIHGTGSCKPVLFNSHLDVVEAKREDWSVDPFHFTEKDGWWYGRGSTDDKDGDAALVADFIRLKQEGFQPKRDLILALTADEETGDQYNGVDFLLAHHRDLIDAEYCINEDSGGGMLKDGKRQVYQVQAAEKTYLTFTLTTTNPGGHSSLPVKQNAIYELVEGLGRLRGYSFPIHLNDVTRSYFERLSHIETGPMADDLRALAGGVPIARRGGPLIRKRLLQCRDAHHLRAHYVERRSRRKRPAAAGHRHGELPPCARRDGGICEAHAANRGRRSRPFRSHRCSMRRPARFLPWTVRWSKPLSASPTTCGLEFLFCR